MVRLTYIWHDCFLYEDERLAIVFDFWKDPLRGEDKSDSTGEYSLPVFLQRIDRETHLYVVVSHHHKDHYVKEIFEWGRYFPNIHYVISKDTSRFARHIISPTSVYNGFKPDTRSVTVLKPGETYADELLTIDAFNSTDIGNSYALKIGNVELLHAGDLNAWIWKEESTTEEVETAIRKFDKILDTIHERYQKFDIAMFPVDSRIGKDYFTGAYMFVRKFDVAHFFPMHFGLGTAGEQLKYQQDASATERYANPERGEYICLQAPYSSFSMPSSHSGHTSP